jgi:amidohydrolase
MHACGHDVNITCLVGTARVLAGMKDRWHGTLVFIGQPAEETGQGAKAMLDAGLFTKFPRPDFGLALHCDARYPHGHVNYRIGQLQANVDSVDIVVRGRGGHGAAPHTTIDPVVLAARIVLDLQTLVSRERDPFEPVVITVGSIHGGTKHNIIPGEVRLQLTVRTMTDPSRKTVLEGIARIARAAAQAAGAPEPVMRHAPEQYTPALVNHPELSRRMVALLKGIVGPDRVHERPPSMGGEDFSRYALAGVPTFYYHLGSVAPERYADALKGGPALPPTHSAFYYPVPEPTIRTGVLTMSLAVLDLMGAKAAKVPVLFDTDIGDDIDDAFALALLLKSPEIELRGVTTVFGDAPTRARIVCRLLDAEGRKDIPVASGPTPQKKAAATGQMEYGLRPGPTEQLVKEDASEFLYRQLKAHPGELTLLAVGPLTNIAELLTRHPDCKPWIKRIVIMGGSVRVGYDHKSKPEPEWNIVCDIKAAQVVFAAGVPLVVAPLDATSNVPLGPEDRQRIFAAGTPLAKLEVLYKLWGKKTPVLFDPVAASLCFTERYCTMEELRLQVDDKGLTRIADGKSNTRVATSIRPDEFVAWFVERLAKY